ncbi:MAG: UDP-N-acetylmuramate dehydrogenase [Myxococcota bacterium]
MDDLRRDVPLAPRTTLELGGPAEFFLEARDPAQLNAAIRWARAEGHAITFLGGGSNVVVADEGVHGLVISIGWRGIEALGDGRLKVQGGEDWDAFVARAVNDNLAGVECLAGIPGLVGATPIQNVGAYGQDVSQCIEEVRVLDLETLEVAAFSNEACDFAYRDSFFKRNPGRYVVTDVTFALQPGGPPTIRYAELQRNVDVDASIAEVRETILRLRRRKSMVLDPEDPNRRSAGSFFTNPIVQADVAEALVRRAHAEGIVSEPNDVPRWPAGTRTKLAAGWLIERAGFEKGTRRENVGLSSKHALALVHHGGGSTRELLAFADEIRERVRARFGVVLEREPRLLGNLNETRPPVSS